MNIAARLYSIMIAALSPLALCALSPVGVDMFFNSVSRSPNVEIGVWNGRGDKCMEKAKETGYLMLWFLYAADAEHPDIPHGSVRKFLENDLCSQHFCDLVNGYQYIILCCEDYGGYGVYDRKNEIYGYPDPTSILNEATGKYERNHCGFPVKCPSYKMDNVQYCDCPPSIHLIKFDANANVIFHICSDGGNMVYDTAFSPYAKMFPIPAAMCTGTGAKDRFAAWLKQYLDLYPSKKQISEYRNSGGDSMPSIASGAFGYRGSVEMAITETENPTEYQVMRHRGNLMFRTVATIGDTLARKRIEVAFSRFDENCSTRSFDGTWFINHDFTLSAISSEISSVASIDVIPDCDCTFYARQRVGSGFTLCGYDITQTTNILHETVISESGTFISLTATNIATGVSSTPFTSKTAELTAMLAEVMVSNKLYRISVNGNAVFDVFSSLRR